jgi:hypothetical protein
MKTKPESAKSTAGRTSLLRLFGEPELSEQLTGIRAQRRTVLVHSAKCFSTPGDQEVENLRTLRSQQFPPSGIPALLVPEVKVIPEAMKSPERFRLLQKLEAVVVERLDNSFIARFQDHSRGGVEEEAEIPLDEISEDDLPLVQEGAVFYWSIGYERKAFGQLTRVSLIRFRRLPSLTQEDVDAARIRASFLSASLTRASEPPAANA